MEIQTLLETKTDDCRGEPGSAGSILKPLVAELERATQLIASIDDNIFRLIANGTGSIGAQLRHDLDFITSFLNGFETGQIDYHDRQRDVRVETDREYAMDRYRFTTLRLNSLDPRLLGRSVLVASEIDRGLWLPSSFAREAEFVHTHTVHHHALVREKLAGFGIATSEHFGVAPSTIEYWARKAA